MLHIIVILQIGVTYYCNIVLVHYTKVMYYTVLEHCNNTIQFLITLYFTLHYCGFIIISYCNKQHDIIILIDDNINTINDYNKSSYTNNFELKQLQNKLIIDRSLTTHNFQPTFFQTWC